MGFPLTSFTYRSPFCLLTEGLCNWCKLICVCNLFSPALSNPRVYVCARRLFCVIVNSWAPRPSRSGRLNVCPHVRSVLFQWIIRVMSVGRLTEVESIRVKTSGGIFEPLFCFGSARCVLLMFSWPRFPCVTLFLLPALGFPWFIQNLERKVGTTSQWNVSLWMLLLIQTRIKCIEVILSVLKWFHLWSLFLMHCHYKQMTKRYLVLQIILRAVIFSEYI